MAAHTPGPYHVTSEGYVGSDRHGFVPIRSPFRQGFFSPNIGGDGHEHWPTALANAKLFKAAPDLLAIAEDLSEWFKKVDAEGGDDYLNGESDKHPGNGWNDLDAIVQRARAAGRATE